MTLREIEDRPKSVMLARDTEVLKKMLDFYGEPGDDVLDVTANARRMWRGIDRFVTFVDIDPVMNPDVVGDFRALPIRDSSFDIIVFDPPHLPHAAATDAADPTFVRNYGLAHSPIAYNISSYFPPFLVEARRVLRQEGLIFAKLKDYVHNHEYQWTLADFIGAVRALKGLTPCDLIVKRDPSSGMTSSKWRRAHHVRNVHCWWVVVRKGRCEARRKNFSGTKQKSLDIAAAMNYLEEEDQRVSEEAMGEVRTFNKGDRVVAAYDQGRPGTVREVGEQQTGVQWDDRRYFGSDVNYVPNDQLVLLDEVKATVDLGEADRDAVDDPGEADAADDDLDEPTSDDVEDESDESGEFDDEVPEEPNAAAEPGDAPPAASSSENGHVGETASVENALAETQREHGDAPPATASDDEDWENFKNSPEEAERLKVVDQLPDATEPGDHALIEVDHEETEVTAAETRMPSRPIPASCRVADRDMPSMAIEDLLALYQEMGREAVAIGLGVNERKSFPTMSQAVAACIAIKRRIHIHHQEADRRATKQREAELKRAAKRATAPRKVAATPKKTVVREPSKKVAHRNGAGRPPNGESKTAAVGRLLRRKSGTTTAEILGMTGWPAVSVPAVAKACGLALRKEKNGGVTRYYGEEA